MTRDMGIVHIGPYPMEKRGLDISLRFHLDFLNEREAFPIHTPLDLIDDLSRKRDIQGI
jgi:hypothetical protein